MQNLTTLQELKIDFFQMTHTAHGQHHSRLNVYISKNTYASVQCALDSDDRQLVGHFELKVSIAYNM